VEEALVEMYLAGVSVRRVEDITEALWGTRVSPSTVSELNQKIYAQIEAWRNRPIEGNHPYVFLDGLWLKRSWGGEVRNVSLLVAIGVNDEGFREVLAVAEGSKEDKASWTAFLRHLKERGLKGVRLFVSDKCLGLVESLGEFYPEALWQRCAVHFYRNVWTAVPTSKVKEVAAMLKAIHAQEDRAAARQKAEQVAAKLREMKLADAAAIVAAGIEETLYYYGYPREHWRCLRTNNPLERMLREVRRRTCGSVPGRQVSPDAGRGQIASCSRHQVGHAALPGHEPSDGGERSGMSARETTFGSPRGGRATQPTDRCLRKCAKNSGHYRSRTSYPSLI
jgi:transposase-like protein